MHQNLAVILWQFIYGKNSFIVLISQISKVFGLWDDIYRKEVVRFLEQARRWDPVRPKGKKEKKVNVSLSLGRALLNIE